MDNIHCEFMIIILFVCLLFSNNFVSSYLFSTMGHPFRVSIHNYEENGIRYWIKQSFLYILYILLQLSLYLHPSSVNIS